MFTGLVRDVGTLKIHRKMANSSQFIIETQLPASTFFVGSSLACNGICLTVTHIDPETTEKLTHVTTDVGPQTLAVTNLGALKAGDSLNLEPALKLGDEMGGHHVTGHVDTLCKVLDFSPTNEGFHRLCIEIPACYHHWLVEKGSIAVRGVSLTVASLHFSDSKEAPGSLEIMLIPHTLEKTNLNNLKKGDTVEIEFDQTVKAIASIVESVLPKLLQKSLL